MVSEKAGFGTDQLATREAVGFVEDVLTDFRENARNAEAMNDILNLLKVFSRFGQREALELVWRLDEIFR